MLLSGLVALSFGVNLFLLFHLRKTYKYLAELAFLTCENTTLISMLSGNARISVNTKPKVGSFVN